MPSSPGRPCLRKRPGDLLRRLGADRARELPPAHDALGRAARSLRRSENLLDLRVVHLLADLLDERVDRVRHLRDERVDHRVHQGLVRARLGLEAEAPAELLDVAVERREVGHQLVVGDEHGERCARRLPRTGREDPGRSACSGSARASSGRCSPSVAAARARARRSGASPRRRAGPAPAAGAARCGAARPRAAARRPGAASGDPTRAR